MMKPMAEDTETTSVVTICVATGNTDQTRRDVLACGKAATEAQGYRQLTMVRLRRSGVTRQTIHNLF